MKNLKFFESWSNESDAKKLLSKIEGAIARKKLKYENSKDEIQITEFGGDSYTFKFNGDEIYTSDQELKINNEKINCSSNISKEINSAIYNKCADDGFCPRCGSKLKESTTWDSDNDCDLNTLDCSEDPEHYSIIVDEEKEMDQDDYQGYHDDYFDDFHDEIPDIQPHEALADDEDEIVHEDPENGEILGPNLNHDQPENNDIEGDFRATLQEVIDALEQETDDLDNEDIEDEDEDEDFNYSDF